MEKILVPLFKEAYHYIGGSLERFQLDECTDGEINLQEKVNLAI